MSAESLAGQMRTAARTLGNHAHTVLRRPRGDFGDDLLAAYYARAHP
jgi:hypothetical protein